MIDLFTKQERIFISFLVFGILLGAAIRLYRSYVEPSPEKDLQLTVFEQQVKEKAAEIDSMLEEQEKAVQSTELVPRPVAMPSVMRNASSKRNPVSFPVNINQATIEDLIQVPQIGRVLATRIVEYRNTHGDFKQIEELLEVKGIGPRKLEIIRPYVCIQHN